GSTDVEESGRDGAGADVRARMVRNHWVRGPGGDASDVESRRRHSGATRSDRWGRGQRFGRGGGCRESARWLCVGRVSGVARARECAATGAGLAAFEDRGGVRMSVRAIEQIKAAGPLNVVWGAVCSGGSTDINWPIICLAELWRLRRVARLLGAKSDKGVAR